MTTLRLADLALARCRAGEAAEARALLSELHGMLWGAGVDDGARAVPLMQLGEIHAELGEHASARGCFAAAFAHLGADRLAAPALSLELTCRYAASLIRTRDLGGLEAMLRGERAAVIPRGAPASEGERRWVDQVAHTLASEARAAEAAGPGGAGVAARLRGLAASLSATPAPVAPDPAALAAPWLAPIAGASPVGVEATQDPRYEGVLRAIALLGSPAADERSRVLAWRQVQELGGELLAEVTKDLTIAAYVAHAMVQREGAVGVVRGLALLRGLVERYWEAMFPDVTRVKRRANALAWYVERTAAAIEQGRVHPIDPVALEAALATLERLDAATRARLGAATPAFGSLREALRRRVLALPPT